MFEIEKDIAVPAKIGRPQKYPLKYPLRLMEVGDSFFISCINLDARMVRSRLGNPIARLKPKKFCTRSVEGGIRVWRLA